MKKMSKVLVLVLALALVISVFAVSTFAVEDTSDGITVFLKPNSNWNIDNARFAVYTWDGGEQWFDMTSTGIDGTYEVTLPAGISNIIFCRMNPGTTDNNWDNRWNQTSDLKVQTNGNDLYTVSAGAWSKGAGSWSKFTVSKLSGAGTEANPYLIRNIYEFNFFKQSVNSGATTYNAEGVWVALGADIDLKNAVWTEGIGDGHVYSFDGCFDGKGHTIKNLHVQPYADSDNPETAYICGGLFGYIYGPVVIRDLTIENATIATAEGGHNVGVLAGFAYKCDGALIENVNIKGDVKVDAPNASGVGAILGYSYANGVEIKDCTVDVNDGSFIKGETFVGGITGYSYSNSVFEGCSIKNIDVNGVNYVGGISGITLNGTKVSTSVVENVDVAGDKCVGSVVGAVSSNGGTLDIEDCTFDGPALGGEYGSKANVVCSIGNKYYTTLADAIAAAGAGDVVIELLADATMDYTARQTVGAAGTTSLTINGNGKVLTLNQTNSDWSSLELANANGKLVLNDLTIEKTGYGDTSGAWNTHTILIRSYVEINNCTINNALGVSAGAVLNNVDINEANGYYGLWVNANGQSVTMNGGSITATNGGRGIKIADQYVDNVQKVTLAVTDTVFTTAKKAAVLVTSTEGADITATNVDISGVAADSANVAWVDEGNATDFGNTTVNGNSAAIENAASFVATVGNNGVVEAYYTSLAAAVAAGGEITLISDVELTEKLVIPAGAEIVLDLNGYVLSGVSSEAKASAVIENKGSLTVKSSVDGGKITSKALTPDTNWGGDGQLAFPSYANNTIANRGTLVLESGMIENTSVGGGATYAIDNYAGTITINGGKVYCENNIAIRFFANNTSMGITVNGGEIEGVRAIWVQLPSSNAAVAPEVNVTVKGGVLSTNSTGQNKFAIYSYSYGNGLQNVKIDISGGTFNGDIALAGGSNDVSVETLNISGGTFNGEIYSYADVALAAPAITITDGNFSSNSAEIYTEDDGFRFVANANGGYSVTEANSAPEIREVDGVKYWFIGDVNTGIKAEGIDGEDGKTPYIGQNGNWFIGDQDTGIAATGKDGTDGVDGITPLLKVDSDLEGVKYIFVSYDNGASWTKLVALADITGPQGNPGQNGTNGSDGQDGAPGQDGVDGITPKLEVKEDNGEKFIFVSYDNGASWEKLVALADITGPQGNPGQDGANGSDGKDGVDGADGKDGADGADGKDGVDGANGADGKDADQTLLITSMAVSALCVVITIVAIATRKNKRRSWWFN